jgi:hypothetical protein
VIAWLLSALGIVADCPPELSECENCREPHCDQKRFEACERRLVTTELCKHTPGNAL